MATPSGDEQVRYDILIEAKQALEALRQVLKLSEDNTQRIQLFSDTVLATSKQWGVSWQQALNVYKQLNAELSKSKKPTLFGNVGGQDLFANSEKYMQSLEDAGRLESMVGAKGEEMGAKVESGSNRAVRGIDAMRIALGAIVAMIVFNVIQAFGNLFGMAIKGLREMETNMYNLANAEKTLSEQGIGIKPEDLQAIIDKMQKLDPLLSKIQATELVSSAATKLAPLGFDKKQIEDFSQSVVLLAIRNKGLGKSFEETQSQMENAFLSGRVSTGINQLGVKLTDQIVKDEALRLGLVKTADEFDKLTGKMESQVKAAAMLSLVKANAEKDLSHLPEYFKTADAAFGIFQARLQDFLTLLGQKAGPAIQTIFLGIANILSKMIDYMEKNSEEVNVFFTGVAALAQVTVGLIGLWIKFMEILGKVGVAINNIISKVPFVKSLVDKFFGSSPTPVDTPTSGSSISSPEASANENKKKAVADAESRIQDIMQESADKKADIERDYGRKLEDIARQYSQKLEDIAREYSQKREDALRAYNQKVEDINRQADEDIQKAKEDARKADIDREKKYQEQLRELREKFLFDLQDALENRDARQVLRLIRQYNMDKKNLEERHKLERQQAKKDLADKLADIERERQLKLQAAQREYQDKLAEIAIGEARARQEAQLWQQRQLEDANLWHQRQLQEYRQFLQRKLRDLAEALIKEYQLTAAGAAAIYGLLSSYFGAGGALSQLLSSGLSATMNGILNTTSNLGGTSGGSNSGAFADFASTFASVTGGQGYGLAEGGTLIATHPTAAMFGENGPERVDVTPLNKTGNNVGKVFGDRSAAGVGGDVIISLELSPDLEARIIDSSLDNISVHLEKVTRSK